MSVFETEDLLEVARWLNAYYPRYTTKDCYNLAYLVYSSDYCPEKISLRELRRVCEKLIHADVRKFSGVTEYVSVMNKEYSDNFINIVSDL